MFNLENLNVEGYVYVISNPSMPNIIKIGSTENPIRRLKELESTGVPTAFEIRQLYKFTSIKQAEFEEKNTHQLFEKYRINNNREFFHDRILGNVCEYLSNLKDVEMIYSDEYSKELLEEQKKLIREEQERLNTLWTTKCKLYINSIIEKLDIDPIESVIELSFVITKIYNQNFLFSKDIFNEDYKIDIDIEELFYKKYYDYLQLDISEYSIKSFLTLTLEIIESIPRLSDHNKIILFRNLYYCLDFSHIDVPFENLRRRLEWDLGIKNDQGSSNILFDCNAIIEKSFFWIWLIDYDSKFEKKRIEVNEWYYNNLLSIGPSKIYRFIVSGESAANVFQNEEFFSLHRSTGNDIEKLMKLIIHELKYNLDKQYKILIDEQNIKSKSNIENIDVPKDEVYFKEPENIDKNDESDNNVSTSVLVIIVIICFITAFKLFQG